MSPSRLSLWPGLPPGIYARPASRRLPYPLNEPSCVAFARARHGLWQGVQELGLEAGDEVLVPAYHHGSEVEALCRAGLVCRFYDVGDALEPDMSELESLMGPRTRALHLIHYFGFPQDAVRWGAWSAERGLYLIEDVAQAWLATIDGVPLGSFGDLAIFCPYKTFGIPHIGLLRSSTPAVGRNPGRGLGLGPVARLHATWLMGRSGWLDHGGSRVERMTRKGWQDDHALGEPSGPFHSAAFLLPRAADAGAAALRRANYQYLLSELAELVPPPFRRLPAGASPLVFPILTSDTAELLDRLERQRILARPFWPLPHPSLPTPQFPHAAFWRGRLIALPVHQELRRKDLERVVGAVSRRSKVRAAVRIEPVESLESIRDEWTELAQRTGNVFATWEWNSIWWRHFGKGHRLLVTACRLPGGKLVGILPLYLWRVGPLRVVRFLGHGSGDQLGPICDASDNAIGARALGRALAEGWARWDIFLGEQIPGDQDWAKILGAKVLSREGAPAIRLSGTTWEDYLDSRGRRLRHEVRHDTRTLARDHALRFRLADDPARLDQDLDLLFALHKLRWPDSRFTKLASFHRDFARCAFERGWLRLWFLELDGQPVAAWYGFRFGRAESYYQGGRDPAWARSSVGIVLVAHTIKMALQDDMSEYRFLRGGEEYKYRFATHDPGLVTISSWRGITGRLVLAAAPLGDRSTIKTILRRKLHAH